MIAGSGTGGPGGGDLQKLPHRAGGCKLRRSLRSNLFG